MSPRLTRLLRIVLMISGVCLALFIIGDKLLHERRPLAERNERKAEQRKVRRTAQKKGQT